MINEVLKWNVTLLSKAPQPRRRLLQRCCVEVVYFLDAALNSQPGLPGATTAPVIDARGGTWDQSSRNTLVGISRF
jgi:hypothetical protein